MPTEPTPLTETTAAITDIDELPRRESPRNKVPAVVVVMVTRNPGPWFADALESVARQEYANRQLLVVDAGSVTDIQPIVASVAPNALIRREGDVSFAMAANAAAESIEGAAFYLFLHDDVVLGPGSIQAMVEQAFRDNAGIVGPKLVDWDDTSRIRSVGSLIDKFGFSRPIAEPGELDQGQHDASREVFHVSTAALLIRSDLFADMGGFSTDIVGAEQDLDLCWRAKVAGARTTVMPAAVVRHRERATVGDPSGRAVSASMRNRARVLLVCYSPTHLIRVLPQALALSLVDAVLALFRRRYVTARSTVGAILWNIGHLPTTVRVRGEVKRSRRVPDEEIRKLQVRGSTRVSSYSQTLVGEREQLGVRLLHGRSEERSSTAVPPAFAATLFGIVALLLLLGSRGLITDGVPAIREFVPHAPSGAMFREWWSGWRTTDFGSPGGAPTLLGVLGVVQQASFGSEGLIRTLVMLGPLGLGVWSVWRASEGAFTMWARTAMLGAYVVNPVPYNAIVEGRWQALVLYAAMPQLFRAVAGAGGWGGFAGAAGGSSVRRAVGLAVVLSIAAMVAPVVVVVAAVTLGAVLVAMQVNGISASSANAARVVAGAIGLTVAIHLSWVIGVLTSPRRWNVLFGVAGVDPAPPDFWQIMGFDTGDHGGAMYLALAAAVVVAVFVASGERRAWAFVGAQLFVGGAMLVVLSGRLAPGIAMPPAELLLAPAAFGAALCLAVLVDTFTGELRDRSFGWRQVASLAVLAAMVLPVLPMVGSTIDGRWGSVDGDLNTAMGPLDDPDAPAFRTLWLGADDILPAVGTPLTEGTEMLVTDGVRATPSSLFPAGGSNGEDLLREELRKVAEGSTARLGARLAPFAIRYVIVVERLAPLPYGDVEYPIGGVLPRVLSEQLDMRRVEVAPGFEVFENFAARPLTAIAPDGTIEAVSTDLVRTESVGVLSDRDVPVAFRDKALVPGDLLVAMHFDEGWHFDVDGTDYDLEPVGDIAFGAPDIPGGAATLRYSTPWTMIALHVLQLLVVISLPWLGRRRLSDLRLRRPARATSTSTEVSG